jgi:tRNA(Arg) A34 adenosine deaminase TadA
LALTVDIDKVIVDIDRLPLRLEVHLMTHADVQRSRSETDFLRQAIELAVENASAGQLPFGALVVRDGRILGTGVNSTLRDHDPTAHAEVAAIRNACGDLRTLALSGATLVSSCEPCALCHAAAVSAGILRVVYAAPKELAIEMLHDPLTPLTALLAEMQHFLRSLVPEQIVHLPIGSADQPFERFAITVGRSA